MRPDDHVHLQDVGRAVRDLPEGKQPELGNVHDDRRRLKGGQPAPALQSEIDLAHARSKPRICGVRGGKLLVMRECLLEQPIVLELRLEGRECAGNIVGCGQRPQRLGEIEVIGPGRAKIEAHGTRVDAAIVQV